MSNNKPNTYLFASESVTEGHPDKMCDQISDAILDAILKQDPEARVAVETLAATDLIVVAGEVTTSAIIDYEDIVRKKVIEIGYDNEEYGFNGHTCEVQVRIGQQSSEIANGVDNALEVRSGANGKGSGNSDEPQVESTAHESPNNAVDSLEYSQIGAGDQGLMFGYATNENPDYMPTAINLAHMMTKRLAELRKTKVEFSWLRPDGKAQVIIEYKVKDNKHTPVAVHHVLISTQHSPEVNLEFVQKQVQKNVIDYVLKAYNKSLTKHGVAELDISNTDKLVNPAGEWNVGGPKSDAGLTGRKIIVDTYGGYARHGGGNFQGKDATKVDRSAAYALRWIAKNVVAAGLADRCEIQVSYAIGKAEPLGLYLDTFGTATDGIDDDKIKRAILRTFDLRPAAIIDSLNLKHITNYQEVAKYGHFGSNAVDTKMTWENVNKISELKDSLNDSKGDYSLFLKGLKEMVVSSGINIDENGLTPSVIRDAVKKSAKPNAISKIFELLDLVVSNDGFMDMDNVYINSEGYIDLDNGNDGNGQPNREALIEMMLKDLYYDNSSPLNISKYDAFMTSVADFVDLSSKPELVKQLMLIVGHSYRVIQKFKGHYYDEGDAYPEAEISFDININWFWKDLLNQKYSPELELKWDLEKEIYIASGYSDAYPFSLAESALDSIPEEDWYNGTEFEYFEIGGYWLKRRWEEKIRMQETNDK